MPLNRCYSMQHFHASLKFRFAYDLEKVVAVCGKNILFRIFSFIVRQLSLINIHTEIGKTTATISIRNALDAIAATNTDETAI